MIYECARGCLGLHAFDVEHVLIQNIRSIINSLSAPVHFCFVSFFVQVVSQSASACGIAADQRNDNEEVCVGADFRAGGTSPSDRMRT